MTSVEGERNNPSQRPLILGSSAGSDGLLINFKANLRIRHGEWSFRGLWTDTVPHTIYMCVYHTHIYICNHIYTVYPKSISVLASSFQKERPRFLGAIFPSVSSCPCSSLFLCLLHLSWQISPSSENHGKQIDQTFAMTGCYCCVLSELSEASDSCSKGICLLSENAAGHGLELSLE